jgi:hypothetical protein
MAGWKEKLALTAQRNRQEIVRAKLNRREMMRLGLLTAGGTLVIRQGLSSRAFADSGGNSPPSPPITPWLQPMPILPIKAAIDPTKMTAGPDDPITGVPTKIVPPDDTSLLDGATKRFNQQLWTVTNNGGSLTFGGLFPP